MKLSCIAENDITRRDFLKKGVATAASSAFDPLQLLLSVGFPPAVANGVQAGQTVPFFSMLTAAPDYHGSGNPVLSRLFNDIINVSAFSRRLSDTGLIMGFDGGDSGWDDCAMLGGEIGLDKLAYIVKAANDKAPINLAGTIYQVIDDNKLIHLIDLTSAGRRGRGIDITIFKDPNQARKTFEIEPVSGNPIQKLWDRYLKFSWLDIDQAASKIIDNMGLDISQLPRAALNSLKANIKDSRDIVNADRDMGDTGSTAGRWEHHGSMHQVYESFDKRLVDILNGR